MYNNLWNRHQMVQRDRLSIDRFISWTYFGGWSTLCSPCTTKKYSCHLRPWHLTPCCVCFTFLSNNCICDWISHYFPWYNDLTIMDSVNASELREFLSSNIARMDRQEEQLLATGCAVPALVLQVSRTRRLRLRDHPLRRTHNCIPRSWDHEPSEWALTATFCSLLQWSTSLPGILN